jgi:hypothetical protein
MPDVFATHYEAGFFLSWYRLWRSDGIAVELNVAIPAEVWLRLSPEQQTEIVQHGIAFGRLHYPDLLEEQPDGEHRADGEPGPGPTEPPGDDGGAPGRDRAFPSGRHRRR